MWQIVVIFSHYHPPTLYTQLSRLGTVLQNVDTHVLTIQPLVGGFIGC